jgi:hypothetical protein
MRYIMMLLVLLSGQVTAHQWTPTYPELKYSHVEGILKVRMELFNSRKDVSHFEVSVFDEDWNPIKFAVSERIMKVNYLGRKSIDIYIRETDKYNATYVCSRSKTITEKEEVAIVTSRICSKIK